MCFPWKKKPDGIPVTNAQFAIGDRVVFKHRGDRTIGHIYRVYAKEPGKVIYDIQVGGQCPYMLYEMEEDKLSICDRV